MLIARLEHRECGFLLWHQPSRSHGGAREPTGCSPSPAINGQLVLIIILAFGTFGANELNTVKMDSLHDIS